MANRREFIQAGMAVAMAATPTLSRLAPGTAALGLYKVIYDQRFAAGQAFAARASAQGVSTHAISGPVHALWYEDLYQRWRSQPVAIAGLTTYNPMFLLSMMAQDVRMRVIYRAHHRLASDGRVEHEWFGPRRLQDRRAQLVASPAWAEAAAESVLNWPAQAVSVAPEHSSIGAANRRALDGQTLISWIIAPARRTGAA